MRPRTRLQAEVWRLHHTLPFPHEHEQFVISKHSKYYATHYKNIVCLECNHTWKPDMQFWAEEMVGVTCPSCNGNLKKAETNRGIARRILTYGIAQVVGRFQVVRYFSCWKHLSKNKKPHYHFRSCFEEWKDWEKGKRVIVGRTTTWTGDGFSSTDYEVREAKRGYYRSSEYDTFASDINCPGAKFIPRFDKYGLNKYPHDCDFRSLINLLEMSPKVETILKARQTELLFHAVHRDGNYSHNQFWPQIKIAIRHKYKVRDAGMWYDYLHLLRKFGKDINNPKFILPKNLNQAHDDYVAKKRKLDEAERVRREIKRQEKERAIAEAEAALASIKSEVFKDFFFQKGNLKIVPLIEEADVMEEGEILQHCVHTNEYHKKAGILLMSARADDKRLETLEISLATYKIIQCRGLKNEKTEFHDEIIALVKQNMGKITKLVENAKHLKELDANLDKMVAA